MSTFAAAPVRTENPPPAPRPPPPPPPVLSAAFVCTLPGLADVLSTTMREALNGSVCCVAADHDHPSGPEPD